MLYRLAIWSPWFLLFCGSVCSFAYFASSVFVDMWFLRLVCLFGSFGAFGALVIVVIMFLQLLLLFWLFCSFWLLSFVGSFGYFE